ncbi:hypothetical protein [Xanthocytophaga agilis]|uniref:tRNA (Guanine-N1)-methyltransferase n=1 Tax=Xanthocytophaga agilis TaxID=3048010 RepID=A0AAE3R3A4_9BACT|nr:hypothetical protein [Xanthocytophaga agilis]MDJ1502866.1 hypothetical protein [Xanthocytophaga agilis]
MKNLKKSIILSLCILQGILFSAQAQNSLNSQYQQLKEGSNNYQDFKVIKQTSLDAFWSKVQDSVNVTKKKLKASTDEIQALKTQVAQLEQQVKAKEDQMQKNDEASQQVPVLGINVDKNGYVMFSYIVYVALLAVLAFFFFQYKNSNQITVSIRKDFEEARDQVDEYKKKLLEIQTALGRELQTERNRVDEMKQEISKLRNQTAAK